MILVKKLLAYCGIGGAEIDVQIPDVKQHRGSRIVCTVTLHGGTVAQTIKRLDVRLACHAANNKQRLGTLETHTLAEKLRLEAGQTEQFSCGLELPRDLSLGLNICTIQTTVKMNALLLPYSNIGLYILPEREFYAVAQAMVQLGFYLKNPLAQSWASGIITTNYLPPESLQDQIASAELHLHADDDCLEGHLLLDASEKSLAQKLKAFLGKNRLSIPITFARRRLLDEAGSMTPEGAVPVLKKALAESLILPDNAAQWMLRASVAPPIDTDELLRPAKGTGDTIPNELLRSAPQNASPETFPPA